MSDNEKEKYDADILIKAIVDELRAKKDSEEFIYKKKTGDFVKGDLNQGKWDKFENKLTKNIQALQIYKKYNEKIKSFK